MERISLAMYRSDLVAIPDFDLPAGYRIRCFQMDDIEAWAKVEVAAGEFLTIEAATNRFMTEFGAHLAEMKERCLFLENEQGGVIGTATAWYGQMEETEEVIGRIHWVGIIPAYQGKGLAKPLLSAALNVLKKYHRAAYLTSQTTSYQAINLYLNYGFQPRFITANWQKAWSLMEKVLQREIILD